MWDSSMPCGEHREEPQGGGARHCLSAWTETDQVRTAETSVDTTTGWLRSSRCTTHGIQVLGARSAAQLCRGSKSKVQHTLSLDIRHLKGFGRLPETHEKGQPVEPGGQRSVPPDGEMPVRPCLDSGPSLHTSSPQFACGLYTGVSHPGPAQGFRAKYTRHEKGDMPGSQG